MKIPISWLINQDFCEYQIKLRCSGENPESIGTVMGSEIHSKLESHATVMSVADAVANTIVKGEFISFVEAQVLGDRTVGRVDLLQISPEYVEVVDYKPRTKNGVPYRGEIRQVQCYALAFRQQFIYYRQPIIATVADRDDPYRGPGPNRLWSKELDESDIADVNDALDRIEGIINGTRAPQPTTNRAKCGGCRFEDICGRSCV